jgi:hypothetical protein
MEKHIAHKSHEAPRPAGSANRLPSNRGGDWNGIHKPCTLKQALYPLLSNKLERFLIYFGSKVSNRPKDS